MSAGEVHVIASVSLAGAFATAGLITGDPDGYEYALGALLGTILSPDLDVDKSFIGDKIILKRLGSIPHRAWRSCWHFYRKSIKHGSELSHFPVISTLGRVAYLFLFCVIIPCLVLSWFGFDFWYEVQWYFGILCQRWKIVMGLIGSDTIHWGLDVLTTEHKGHGTSLDLYKLWRSFQAPPKTSRR